MLKKSGVKIAAKVFATAAGMAALTALVAPAASAGTLGGEWSVAYGSQTIAQFTAQGQCFDRGWKHASNATYTWDDSRNAWRAQVWCS